MRQKIQQENSRYSDHNHPVVQRFFSVMRDFHPQRVENDRKRKILRDFVERDFVVEHGTNRISSKKLSQAITEVLKRVRVPDGALHGEGRPEHIERICDAGLNTIKDISGYVQMFTGKNGLFQEGYGFGDALAYLDIKKEGVPFKFRTLEMKGFYTNSDALGIRHSSKPSRQIVLLTEVSMNEIKERYPDKAKEVIPGRINFHDSENKEWEGDSGEEKKGEKTDMAVCFDIENETFAIIVGKNSVLCELKLGKDYPYFFTNREEMKEAYFPVFQYVCLFSNKGFHNNGIYSAFYDLACVYEKLTNLNLRGIGENQNPDKFVTVGKNQSNKFLSTLKKHRIAKAQGINEVVPIEIGPEYSSGALELKTLQRNSYLAEADAALNRLITEFLRYGIDINSLDPNELATGIIANEENANRFISLVNTNNAPTVQFMNEVIIDQAPKLIKKTNKTRLRLTTRVRVNTPEGFIEIDPEGITLGMVAHEWSMHYYFYKMNDKSGVDQSRLKLGYITRGLQAMPENVHLQNSFLEQIDIDVSTNEQPSRAGNVDTNMQVSENENLQITARGALPGPVA